MEYTQHYIEIPPTFHSDASETLFQRCLGCDIYLLDNGTLYVIEKAYRKYPGYDTKDTVFEYAMCLDCFMRMQEAMSEESMNRVRSYFERHVDLAERQSSMLKKNSLVVDDWLDRCMVKGTPIAEMNEYQIFGQCDGGDLLFTLFPYAIGGEAIDEISLLLSNKTLGEIDGFMDEHFGLPPELRKLLIENKMFVV
ncbi:MAG: hypothetical protein AB8G77_09940 [Rhodothermales bacterium]